MLNFFLTLTFGMLGFFFLAEVYSRTIGAWLFNRKMYKACKEMEVAEEYNLDPDVLLFAEKTQKSKRL